LIARSHTWLRPVESTASKAITWPSGETRGEPSTLIAWGTLARKRMVTGPGGAPSRRAAASAAAPSRAAPATPHASRSRLRRRAATGAGTPACEPPCAIHWSWSFTSCAVWMRSCGSFVRQARTTCSSAGGASGAARAIGTGSLPMIDPISDAWVLPSNARFPVAIS